MYHFYSQIDNLFSGKVTRLYQIKKNNRILSRGFFLVGDFFDFFYLCINYVRMRVVDYPVVTLDYIIMALNFEINFKASRVTSKATLASSEIVVYKHEKSANINLATFKPYDIEKIQGFCYKRIKKKMI